MSQQQYFNNALADFIFDVANSGAIRHLAGCGYTVKQIMEQLDISSPYEKVRQTVWDSFIDSRIILSEEPGMGKIKEHISYIEERGKFGKTSFRRVVSIEEISPRIDWNEIIYKRSEQKEFFKDISAKCSKSECKTAYVSCDIGMLQRCKADRYKLFLDNIDARQKEYIEGLPWPNQRIYHHLDTRMREIMASLLQFTKDGISCYFINQKKKLTIF